MENREMNKDDQILNSLDGIQKAVAPDFFYTRLSGRMQQEFEPKRVGSLILRPVFAISALSVVLIINVFFLTQLHSDSEKQPVVTNEPASIETFARAYDMNTESVYQ